MGQRYCELSSSLEASGGKRHLVVRSQPPMGDSSPLLPRGQTGVGGLLRCSRADQAAPAAPSAGSGSASCQAADLGGAPGRSARSLSRRFAKTMKAPPYSGSGSIKRWAKGFLNAPITPEKRSLYACLSESDGNLDASVPVRPNTSLTRSRPIRVGSDMLPTIRRRSSRITAAVRTAESHSLGSVLPAPRMGRHRDLSLGRSWSSQRAA